MKRQTFSCLWFLLAALLWPSLFSASPAHHGEPSTATYINSEASCPAPPPAWLTTTNITSTSMALSWEANSSSVYYKVEGVDLNSTAVLPTYYTQNNYITYSGLTPGHTYRVSVSASYCLGGSYGLPVVGDFSTPIIIADLIIELNSPCTPDQDVATGLGASLGICVAKNDNPYAPPYSNGVVGHLEYDNQSLDFGIAVSRADVHIGELQSSPFSFETINNGASILCKYGSTTLFTIGNVSVMNVFSDANMTITFTGNYGDFTYCGSTCPVEKPADGNDDIGIDDGALQGTGASERTIDVKNVSAQLSPNPFSESATFRYELKEAGPVEANLFDATGRLVKVVEKTTQQGPGQYECTIDGAGLPHGVYFLHLTTAQNREVFPLVKRE